MEFSNVPLCFVPTGGTHLINKTFYHITASINNHAVSVDNTAGSTWTELSMHSYRCIVLAQHLLCVCVGVCVGGGVLVEADACYDNLLLCSMYVYIYIYYFCQY